MCHTQSTHDVVNDYAYNLIRMKARQLVRRPEFRRYPKREIEQDLWTYLLSRAPQYDPKRGSVDAFIVCVINSAASILIRKRRRRLSVPGEDAQSLEVSSHNCDGELVPTSDTISSEDIDRRTGGTTPLDLDVLIDQEAFAWATKTLSPMQQKICHLLSTSNVSVAARVLGISRRKLKREIALLRSHFERAGFGGI